MFKLKTFLFFSLAIATTTLFSQESSATQEKRSYQTSMINGEAPNIDGDISDAVWDQVDWSGDFIQYEPYEGADPTNETSFKILYDNKNIYVCFRCFDREPEKIVSRMSRRDGFEGDWVEINIDSYNDLRTGFSFTSSVSGVKGDEFITGDGNNWDTNWNPIWYLKTRIDSIGWTAEVAIPLSQLRFSKEKEQTWGLQFTRRDFRNESRSIWQKIPRNSGTWVSGFGKLEGIKNIEPKRQIEIQPYILGQAETFEKEPGNPFATGSKTKFTTGLDGKIGITNDLTLDFTVNPDFGQVEADPSALTLDGFRIFFSEKRPFFIENRSLFSYNISNSFAGGNYDTDNLFYSRRIGASPHGSANGDSDLGIFVKQPDFTTILGAAKFSGKTKSGLSIGLLESVTAREEATIDDNGTRSKEEIEPLTNYIVARVQQDFNNGNTVIGGILTGVQRKIDIPELEFLHKNAYSGGLEFEHKWNERKWRLNGRMVFSRVAGTKEAITETQQSFEHYFQRPGADHLNFDPEATSLSGNGGNISIARLGNKLRFQTGITYRSPGLELNDNGFQLNSDEINHYYWMGYQQTEPKGIFRDWRLNYNHWSRWDFGGTHLHQAFNTNIQGNLKNYWNIGTGITYEVKDISNNWLRGGPTFRKPNGWAWWTFINTDSRKKIRFNVFANVANGLKVKTRYRSIRFTTTVRPNDALNISVGTSFSQNKREDQYVETASVNGNTEYLLSSVNQKTMSFTFRINYNITPDFTLQYYGQPFISKGKFSEFKRVLDPINKDRDARFVAYTPDQLTYNEDGSVYSLDQDLDGDIDFEFDDPDFNFLQFRSNLVARWEYIPGSEVFLVWSQGTTNSGDPDKGLFSSLTDDLFGQTINNIFLLKLTYRFLN